MTTPAEYEFEETLGEGAFAVVKKCVNIETQITYAAKIVEKGFVKKENLLDSIKREREILMQLKGIPNTVQLRQTFQDEEKLYFILDYYPNGDLLKILSEYNGRGLHEECVLYYAAQIVNAIDHIHKLNIIHRDIKPENLLINKDGSLVLSDFGTATRLQDKFTRMNSFVGTAEYVPPELLSQKSVSFAGDIWALGCVLYYLTTGRPAFRGGSDWLTFEKIRLYQLVFPQLFPRQLKALVGQLLDPDENKRPSIKDIKSHPYFESIDWDNLPSLTAPPVRPSEIEMELPFEDTPKVETTSAPLVSGYEGFGLESDGEESDGETVNRRRSMMIEQKALEWSQFLIPDSEVIIRYGYVAKTAGISRKKRMLILTDLPRLFYISVKRMKQMGEIPWSSRIAVEVKSPKEFQVITAKRRYYLEDLEGNAQEWKNAIVQIAKKNSHQS